MRLAPDLLEHAYRNGIFPMPDWLGRIAWHQPDPRAILPLDQFHASRSLQRLLKKNAFVCTYDQDFSGVMRGCATRDTTWITKDFFQGYGALFKLGNAHSVEVWLNGKLAGGVYGVHFGGAFFAESKFHTVPNASKVALAKLVERLRLRKFELLEVQFLTEHLKQFGVIEIPHAEYMRRLKNALKIECKFV